MDPEIHPDAEATASVRPIVTDSAGDVADTATAAFMLLFTGHLDAARDLLAELTTADLMRVAQTASAFAIAADPGAAHQPTHCPACDSPSPRLHPAVQADGGEVSPCGDAWHVDSTKEG